MQDLVTSSRKLLYQNAGPGARLARFRLSKRGCDRSAVQGQKVNAPIKNLKGSIEDDASRNVPLQAKWLWSVQNKSQNTRSQAT